LSMHDSSATALCPSFPNDALPICEKRGLAYGVRTSLIWMSHSNIMSGGTATRSDRAAESLALIEEETKRMAAEGPTQEELDKAKAYLKGSYPLGFDTSSKIAGQLVQIPPD